MARVEMWGSNLQRMGTCWNALNHEPRNCSALGAGSPNANALQVAATPARAPTLSNARPRLCIFPDGAFIHLLCDTARYMAFVFGSVTREDTSAIPLSDVLLTSESVAVLPTAVLIDSLVGTSLQQGSFINSPSQTFLPNAQKNPKHARLFVKMTSPTSRGCVKANFTRIVVARDPRTYDEGHTSGPVQQAEHEVEIDEGFLESSTLMLGEMNGGTRQVRTGKSYLEVKCCNSRQFLTLDYAHTTLPEGDCTVFVHAKDLSRLGCLSGDWVSQWCSAPVYY